MPFMDLMFLIPTIYKAYNRADNKTINIPLELIEALFGLLYKRNIPVVVKIKERIVVLLIFSLKNVCIIKVTIIG